jgi:hypothetical protein
MSNDDVCIACKRLISSHTKDQALNCALAVVKEVRS